MSRSNEDIHGNRRLRRALGLGLSGVALVGLFYFEGMSAQAEAGLDEAVEEVDEAEIDEAEVDEALDDVDALDEAENGVREATVATAAPSGVPSPAAVADGRLAMADLTKVDAAAAMPIAPPAPALVAVPDISGMSLRKAKKQLAAVGLKLSVRDEYGEKIPREFWSEYKVRKQKLDAGTEVEAGSTVKVKARMRMRYAQGY